MVEVFGEERGSSNSVKWLLYAKRFGPVKPFNNAGTNQLTGRLRKALCDYLERRKSFTDDTGNLLPRYQLPPMIASFMKEEDEFQSTQRKEIGVPKGPVEVCSKCLSPIPGHLGNYHSHTTGISDPSKDQPRPDKCGKTKTRRVNKVPNRNSDNDQRACCYSYLSFKRHCFFTFNNRQPSPMPSGSSSFDIHNIAKSGSL